MEQKLEHPHLVVVSYLEWLNWNSRGLLRVSPQRIVWCGDDDRAGAALSSLQFAPDLEPADDAFLIAQIMYPPSRVDGGMLSVLLDGSQFQALSERSHRLMSPTATRMNVDLSVAGDRIQDMWARWKDQYAVESCDAQARRVWRWAWAKKWPSDPLGPHNQSLSKTVQTLAEMTRLFTKDIRIHDRYAETSAESWLRMALAAEAKGLLSADDTADWRLATKAYFTSFMRAKELASTFFQEGNVAFEDALATLPLEREQMIELLSVAVGQHHALRLNIGRDPDLEALWSDLRSLIGLMSTNQSDQQSIIVSKALLAFGRLLPGSAIVAFQAKTDLPIGWANRLLQSDDEAAPFEDVTGLDVREAPTNGESQLINNEVFKEESATSLSVETENRSFTKTNANTAEMDIDITCIDKAPEPLENRLDESSFKGSKDRSKVGESCKKPSRSARASKK